MYWYRAVLDDGGVWTIEGSHVMSLFLPLHGGRPYIQIDGNTGMPGVSYTK
jgi:hypothetical protein